MLLDFFGELRINYCSRQQLMNILSNKPQAFKLKFSFG